MGQSTVTNLTKESIAHRLFIGSHSMTDSNFQRGHSSRGSPLYRACDLCHQKKIRCDRKDPCESCVQSSALCLRTRPRQAKRTSAAKPNLVPSERNVDTLLKRMSRLEYLVNSQNLSEDSSQRPINLERERAVSASQRWHIERTRSLTVDSDAANAEISGPSAHESPQFSFTGRGREMSIPLFPSEKSQTHQNGADRNPQHGDRLPVSAEAQSFMQQELESSRRMDAQKRWVLESAIRVAHDLSTWEPEGLGECLDNFEDVNLEDAPFPSIEYLHIMLCGDHSSMLTSCYLEYSSHVSRQTLEKMGTALVDRSVHGQMRLQYIICVNVYAYLFLGAVDSDDTQLAMQQHLQQARRKYTGYIVKALNQLTVLATPTLALLQALVSGAMFLQDLGHPGKSWQISSAACRICAVLGGRFLANLALDSKSTVATEVRRSFANCYVLDKALSMAFGRTACLPDMKINLDVLSPPGLDHANDILTVFLSFAQIQDILMRETKAPRNGSITNQQRLNLVATLKARMQELQAKIQNLRSKPPHCDQSMLIAEWEGIEFTSFSLMTTIHRLHPSIGSDAALQSECLTCARNALRALKRLKERILGACKSACAMQSALSWTLLLYPLSPFFMVFCNVVENQNADDFLLLKTISDSLSTLGKVSPSLSRIQKLSNELVGLCKPFGVSTLLSQKSHHNNPNSNDSSNNKTLNPYGGSENRQDSSTRLVNSPVSSSSPPSSLPSLISGNDEATVSSPDELNTWPLGDLGWKTIDSLIDPNQNTMAASSWTTQDTFWQRVDLTKPYLNWFTDGL